MERIDRMRILLEQFTAIHDAQPTEQTRITVQIRFPREVAGWVRERQHYGYAGEISEGTSIIMTYQVQCASEIWAWLLAWGAQAEVIAPAELRMSIRQKALALAALLT